MATSGTSSGFADQVGLVLSGRYRLVAPLGTGASATVHLADDVNLQRRVAVKVLHPALATDEAFLRRFRAEARAAAALSHPNIMAVYDWGESPGGSGSGRPDRGPYLVMELLSGGSLRAILDRGTHLSLSQALVVGLEAARALDAAHTRGFVHRDIKPANLLFGDDGRLRIADFGLARALSEAAWTEPEDGLIGTARYAAPEQAAGVRVDGKADVYSLALVLIEAVTGQVPLVANSALATIRLRSEQAVPVPAVMGPLVPILERSLQPDPAARPEASAVVQALLEAARALERPEPLPLAGMPDVGAGDDDVTVLPNRPPADLTVHADTIRVAAADDAPRRRRRWPVLVALVVVLALAGAAVAWRAVQPPSAEVPNVAGVGLDDARAAVDAALAEEGDDVEWAIEEAEEYSDGVAEGVVIRTEPPEGASLDDDGTLTLVVSLGPEPVPVPSLVDMDEAAARAALFDAELVVGAVTREPSETVPPGMVSGWSADGVEKPAELPKGSSVDVRISDGPAPRKVPQLKGSSPEEARAELERLQLEVSIEERFSSDVDKGLVIGTDPPAGTDVARDSAITVYVSKGPDLVKVPNVKGMTLEQAVSTLEKAGLEPDEVFGPARGRADSTDPEAGSSVERGTKVDIYLKR